MPTSDKRFVVRIDTDVHRRIQQLAKDADVSMNQLISGLLRWAAEVGHAGEPNQEGPEGDVRTSPAKEVLWFGQAEGSGPNRHPDTDEIMYYEEPGGSIQLVLDFRPRAYQPVQPKRQGS